MVKRKVAVIHQPDFMPYLGFFHRLLNCDVFVVLDHVQFIRRGWQNRDKIKTPKGAQWLTIPLQTKGKRLSPLNEIVISDETDWRRKHLESIRHSYSKADYFLEIFSELESLYGNKSKRLVDFNMNALYWLMDKLDIKIPIEFSSNLAPKGKSNEMLVDILKKVGATDYLSGQGAKDYFKEDPFEVAGIRVTFQEFKHPFYRQVHGEFIPNLSSIDLLLNCGVDESRKIIRNC